MRVLREYTTADKSAWGRGEWQSEPDKVQGIDEATGLDVLLVRNRAGAWCGYVGVPESHPLFGVGYGERTSALGGDAPDDRFEVHGGLTFASRCHDTGDESRGICHLADIGAADPVWWFGFDCSHAWDISPAYGETWRIYLPDMTYRTREYVAAETARLAAQLAALQPEAA